MSTPVAVCLIQRLRIKCNECNKSLYLPVTDNVIFLHLKGEITAGVYPLLPGDLSTFSPSTLTMQIGVRMRALFASNANVRIGQTTHYRSRRKPSETLALPSDCLSDVRSLLKANKIELRLAYWRDRL
ncbi:TOTE conflict system archaeo-eukaryotic primase domain-containing protein [Collimonas antrihumi]|uniref:TOTE conflict system archaeo-eukaryotic primase domain-containing protein n=1 Tax=Collimonas antrihumi TaxID=1940615 RepID=UPI003CCE641C